MCGPTRAHAQTPTLHCASSSSGWRWVRRQACGGWLWRRGRFRRQACGWRLWWRGRFRRQACWRWFWWWGRFRRQACGRRLWRSKGLSCCKDDGFHSVRAAPTNSGGGGFGAKPAGGGFASNKGGSGGGGSGGAAKPSIRSTGSQGGLLATLAVSRAVKPIIPPGGFVFR